MNIYSNDNTFYKQIADSDAKSWIASLTVTGNLPDNISLKDLSDNAKIYFERTFGKNGEYLLSDVNEVPINIDECKNLYTDTFKRSAVLYLNELRTKKLAKSTSDKERRTRVALSGRVEASKWFSAVYDASFAKSITDGDIVKVSELTYNILFNQENDDPLKASFCGAFIQEARLLFSTIEGNSLRTNID